MASIGVCKTNIKYFQEAAVAGLLLILFQERESGGHIFRHDHYALVLQCVTQKRHTTVQNESEHFSQKVLLEKRLIGVG